MRYNTRSIIGVALLTLAAGVFALQKDKTAPQPTPAPLEFELATRGSLTVPQIASLAPFIEQLWKGNAPISLLPEPLRNGAALVFVQPRTGGGRVGKPIWKTGRNTAEALKSAINAVLSSAQASTIDTLEMVFAHSASTIDPAKQRAKLTNIHRGLRGIEFTHKQLQQRISPTEMLAQNRDFRTLLARFETAHSLQKGAEVRVRIFSADQFLVSIGTDTVNVTPMYRGNEVVTMADVTRNNTQTMADALSKYLFAGLQDDGRQTYKWWPSRGEESQGNNMIRQWMATVAMGRVARNTPEAPELMAAVTKNILYNLQQFYFEEKHPHGATMGLIEYSGKVKLGATALAALALAEHPDRARWAKQEKALRRTIESLWDKSGNMRSFYKPQGREDFHNFYPGEALLYWSVLLRRDGIDTLATDGKRKLYDMFMASVGYFKAWHLQNRNPAFIPWHTQAYYNLWILNGDEQLRSWTFEMNDWLLDVQQWSDTPAFPDVNGRFWDSSRPFGPPHASSTGVYLEGLIAAWKMAKESGDTKRQENYRVAILRGLRSCMQLTFFDDVDMFYIQNKQRVRGGVRETVYNNEIRVDNVQHNLMAQLNILQWMNAEDFAP